MPERQHPGTEIENDQRCNEQQAEVGRDLNDKNAAQPQAPSERRAIDAASMIVHFWSLPSGFCGTLRHEFLRDVACHRGLQSSYRSEMFADGDRARRSHEPNEREAL